MHIANLHARIKGPYPSPTDEETVAMSIQLEMLDQESKALDKQLGEDESLSDVDRASMEERADQIRDSVATMTDALAKATTRLGRGLARVQAQAAEITSENIVRKARKAKKRKLSKVEMKKADDISNELKRNAEAVDEAAADNHEAETVALKKEAEKQFRAEVARSKSGRTEAEIRAEISSIHDELTRIGYRANSITGVPVEAAVLIGRLAKNYIELGTVKTAEQLAKQLQKDAKVSERDVWETLANRTQGNLKQAEKAAKLTQGELKKQSGLLLDIDDEAGRLLGEETTKPSRKSASPTQEATRLKGLLKDAKTAADDLLGLTDARKKTKAQKAHQKKLQRLSDRLGSLESQIKSGNLTKRKAAKAMSTLESNLTDAIAEARSMLSTTESVKSIKDKLAKADLGVEETAKKGQKSERHEAAVVQQKALRKQLSAARALQKATEELNQARAGVFKQRAPKASRSQALKNIMAEIAELKKSAFKTERDDARRQQLVSKLGLLEDMLDGGYRDIKESVENLDTERIKEVKAKIEEVRAFMRVTDKTSILDDQIRTGNFDVPPVQKAAITSERLDRARVKLARSQKKGQAMLKLIESRERLATATPIGKVGIRAGQAVLETGQFFRSIRTMGEFSGLGRQAFSGISKLYFKGALQALTGKEATATKAANAAILQSFKAAFSENTAEGIDLTIKNDPEIARWRKSDIALDLAELDESMVEQEEALNNRILNGIPGIKQIAGFSTRHMVTLNNMVRVSLVKEASRLNPQWGVKEKKAWAWIVNNATGRSRAVKSLPHWLKATLSAGMFSPHFSASRFEIFASATGGLANKQTRKETAEFIAGNLAMQGMLTGLAALAGWDVGDDIEEFDFGRIIIGDTRFDFMHGMNQPWRLIMASIMAGADQVGLRESHKKVDLERMALNVMKYKRSPLVSMAGEAITGEDLFGNPIDRRMIVPKNLVFLFVKDIYDAYVRKTDFKERQIELRKNKGQGHMSIPMSILGGSVATVDSPTMRPRVRRILKSSGAFIKGKTRLTMPSHEKWVNKREHHRVKKEANFLFEEAVAKWALQNEDRIKGMSEEDVDWEIRDIRANHKIESDEPKGK